MKTQQLTRVDKIFCEPLYLLSKKKCLINICLMFVDQQKMCTKYKFIRPVI